MLLVSGDSDPFVIQVIGNNLWFGYFEVTYSLARIIIAIRISHEKVNHMILFFPKKK